MAKSTDEPTPLSAYAQLKAEAKELGIPYVGVKGPALAAAIAAERQRLADEAATKPVDGTSVDGTSSDGEGNQGGGDAPGDDPEASAAGEPGTPPSKRSARNAKAVPITRQNAATWWCPIDDFSMPTYMQGCEKCGARRVDDSVIPA